MKFFIIALWLCWAGAGFAEAIVFPAAKPQSSAPTQLVIASNTDPYAITPIIRAFQELHPEIEVVYEEAQSDALFDHALRSCQTNRFSADLVISSAMTHQYYLANYGCSQPLSGLGIDNALARLPDWANWRNELLGLTFEPAAMIVNKKAFPEGAPKNHIELVTMLADQERFFARVGRYDAMQSGVGYLFDFYDAQYSNTAAQLQLRFDDLEYQKFCCSSQIIDLVADGRLDLGYNVLGSYALFRAELDARLQVVFLDDATPVISRTAYIPKSAQSTEQAIKFIDFMLSSEGQRLLGRGSYLLSSITGKSQIEDILDKPAHFMRPIALDPVLLLGLEE